MCQSCTIEPNQPHKFGLAKSPFRAPLETKALETHRPLFHRERHEVQTSPLGLLGLGSRMLGGSSLCVCVVYVKPPVKCFVQVSPGDMK